MAAGSYSLPTGTTVTAKLKLNSAGQRLLDRFYRLAVSLAITGTNPITRSLTLSYARLHFNPPYTWVFAPGYSYATELTLSRLPPQARTILICSGPGCPFSKRSFTTPKDRTLILAPVLEHRHLAPNDTVELKITAPNTITEVVIFTIRAGRQPSEVFRCQAPGSKAPTVCAFP